MKKKNKILLIIIPLLLLILVGCGYSLSRIEMRFPKEITYENGTGTTCYTDSGMYYIKNKKLFFLDAENGLNTVVCSKADCKHDSLDCNAYIDGLGAMLLYYNGYIFISHFSSNISYDENDNESYSGFANLDCIKCDGSKKYNIYSSDNGAVLSIKAKNDKLYFTAYNFHGEFEVYKYCYDQNFYEYDLRWKRLKRIKSYIADDEQDTSLLEIVKGTADDIYLKYEEYFLDGRAKTTLIKYDGQLDVLREYDSQNKKINFVVNDTKQYELIQNNDIGNGQMLVSESADFYATKKKLLEINDAWADIMNGYILLISSDYNKVLLALNSGKFYLASTCFEGETYISDIYDIDFPNNHIYIDLTDYTGILPGTIFYEDKSKQAVMDFDEFLGFYFIDKEQAKKDDIDKLSWVRFYE